MIKNISIGIVALIVGSFIGFKVTESMGREYIMNNLPIPEGTLDDKDVFIESVPAGSVLIPKSLAAVERKAKNIILLIGDGMSASQVSSYRLLKGGPNARLAVDKFPISGIVLTHSEDAIVTDSASSATAYSTGIKTNNTFLGLDKDKNVLENLTEKIHGYGFVSSLIATSEVTHATPAAFAAHIDLRWKTDEISAQMMDSNVVTILGGGRHFFLPEEMGGKREDGRDLFKEVENSHVLLTHKDQLNDFDQTTSGKVVGLFADEHLRDLEKPENHSTEPSLSEMLNFAIKRSETFMDNGCKGSFIMVEGSQVDWAGHSNDINYLKREMQDLEEAVELAVDYANKNQDTLVIVTADHETGGLLIEPASAADYTGNEVKFSFNTAIGRGSHTGVPVPVYAYGPGSENFTGTLDNTDVYRAMIAALDLTEESGSCLGN
jgi:alkaline phosphatase|tara:strand:+ start:127 stop:1431 length:1305 start_codon:yes stop_codon:yes gene_type:complete